MASTTAIGNAHISLGCVSVNQGRSVNYGLSQSDAELFEKNVTSTINIGQSYVSIRSKWAGVGGKAM